MGLVHSKPGKEPRRFDFKLLLASFGVAVGIVAIVWGVSSSVTGDEQQALPDAIESIDPVRGSTQVLQQSNVFVDLAEGYEGELTIDGVSIPVVSLDELSSTPGVDTPQPGEQITLPPVALYEPGNATITYSPVEDGPIEKFDTGQHTATVVYWPIEEGKTKARSFTWDFYVV